jgi:RNA polymerase sigma-70 factor (ECF subfamily)
MAPATPDEELVRRFQETGSNDHFAELYARYRKRVYMSCRGFFADGGNAEDATQETFVRTYKNMHTFQGGNFAGWLMRIAKNACIDMVRKSHPEVGMEGEFLPDGAAVGVMERTPELRMVVEELWREITALPPDQRRCIEMKIQGYSYEETAARTGLSIDAVKSHLQNGRRMLWLKTKGFGLPR